MKQIWPNYSYSPTTNVLTLTGLNIDRDQLLLVTAANRGRIMYNFADSSVTASAFTSGANTALTLVATTAGLTTTAALVIYYDDQVAGISGTVTANASLTDFPTDNGVPYIPIAFVNSPGGSLVQVSQDPNCGLPISGTVTANAFGQSVNGAGSFPIPIIGYDEDITSADSQIVVPVQISSLNGSIGSSNPLPISGTVTIGSALPTGTNRIGVVTIGAGTVTLGASTSQIGSVTASISNSLTIGSLPALAAGTAQIGSVIASISNTAVTVYPSQGTAVTNSNFTSLTSSTSLVSAVVGRDVLTVFNEGAGNLHISAGATCTTISYQVRLSAGDYWECPQGQLSLAHTAVFATAGTARVTEVS